MCRHNIKTALRGSIGPTTWARTPPPGDMVKCYTYYTFPNAKHRSSNVAGQGAPNQGQTSSQYIMGKNLEKPKDP